MDKDVEKLFEKKGGVDVNSLTGNGLQISVSASGRRERDTFTFAKDTKR